MGDFPRPRVVFSRCLTFENCRYNGQTIASEAVEHFKPVFECITVCPEMEIGLGVPREPIRIVREAGELRLKQPPTGLDVTKEMRRFAAGFLDSLGRPKIVPGRKDAAVIRDSSGFPGPVDGFVLKSRSPSCGLTDTKLFSDASKGSPLPKRIAGLFGGAVLERFPLLPVEDEGRLTNFAIREHFLTRLYVMARLRRLRENPTRAKLVQFQAENKLLFMSYNQTKMRELGRIVANPDKRGFEAVLGEYCQVLPGVFARLPRHPAAINVLMHGFGHFKDRLDAKEKKFFLSTLDSYRDGRVPLSVPQSIVRAWIVRFDEAYLAQQTFFRPYPEELQLISDSGKGRRTS